jgi:ABC-type dipeptide/oligopeptide/nickel transport system ATPase subunit
MSLLMLRDARKSFGPVRAVDGVDLAIAPGEAVGLVGESGCGKSTIARIALKLGDIDSGEVHVAGEDVTRWPESRFRPLRRRVQLVQQTPHAALNPRRAVFASIAEPLEVLMGLRGSLLRERVIALAADVQLPEAMLWRFPHELSGGQKQRVCIARALAPEPDLVILDEPTSALDVSVQAQILAENCGQGVASPSSSSLTTSRWCGRSATGSRSCILAASLKPGRWERCSPRRVIPTPRRFSPPYYRHAPRLCPPPRSWAKHRRAWRPSRAVVSPRAARVRRRSVAARNRSLSTLARAAPHGATSRKAKDASAGGSRRNHASVRCQHMTRDLGGFAREQNENRHRNGCPGLHSGKPVPFPPLHARQKLALGHSHA